MAANNDPAGKKMPFDYDPNTAGIVKTGYRYSSIVILVVSCLVAFGVYALVKIDKNEFPNVTIREGLLVAVYPGASAEQIENEAVRQIEDYVFSFEEVKKSKTHTEVTAGMVIVYVELDDNVDDATPFWNKLKAGVSGLKMNLPPGVLAVEVLSDFGDTSALLITMSSRDKTYREMDTYMDRLKDRLRAIPSVSRLSVTGQQHEQIAVRLDPARLAKYGIGEKEIAATLAMQGFRTTAGSLHGEDYTAPIKVETPINSVKAVADQIVFTTPGNAQTVRLGDVATVTRQYPKPESFITNNGERCIVLSVEMKPGNNVVKMGDEVEAQIKEFETQLPDDVKLFRITNQPYDVNNSVINFLTELLIAVIAVVIAIMILLPIRVALIAASTIPITIFISLGCFYMLGIELNTVTLACLIVSLGMIVDNSVVILDEYVELLSEGVDRKRAALSSATSYFKAIFSATCAISITFFPFLITMTGMMHDFLTDFPWAISLILFLSLIVAEMLVPVLQYHIIKNPKVVGDSSASTKGKKRHFTILGAVQSGYDKLIDWCFAWPRTTLVIGSITLIVSVVIIITTPIQLMPIAERNQFAVEIHLPTGTPLARTSAVADSLARILRKDKRIVSVATFHGCSSPRFQITYAPEVGGPNYAQFIVNTVSNDATIEVLDEYTPLYSEAFGDAIIKFKQLSYSEASSPIEVRVSGAGAEIGALQSVADSVAAVMRKIPGTAIVRTSLDAPQAFAQITPLDGGNLMQRLGLTATSVDMTTALRYSSGVPVAKVWEGDYGIPVVLRTATADTANVRQLADEPIAIGVEDAVPVSQFATIEPQFSFGQISHRNGRPTVTVMASGERGRNIIDLTKVVRKEIEQKVEPTAADCHITYGGEWEFTMETLPHILSALAMAAVIIFFILLFHYKKVRVSLLLVICLVLVLPGVAAGLLIENAVLSLTCTLGVISLMGILVRNVIILIDYAQKLHFEGGLDVGAAALASSKRRMRPIVLTSTAASMGVIPMMISNSSLWQPMGAVIFWGTIVTMVYILTFIPVLFWKTTPKSQRAALTSQQNPTENA